MLNCPVCKEVYNMLDIVRKECSVCGNDVNDLIYGKRI